MNRVVLTVGPQGAGKSTYCQQIVVDDPTIILISRDQIFNHYCGDDWRDPYTGAWEFGYQKMWEAVVLALASNNVKLILDCWNDDDYARRSIVKKLRSAGADWVAAWHFFVPEDVCVEWYLAREFEHRPGIKSHYAEFCRRNHKLFLSYPVEIEQGFDAIYQINPLQLRLFARTTTNG